MQYNFDWDPGKESANLQKHKVDFRRAAIVFRAPKQLSVYDEEHSDEEERWATIGIDSGSVLRVVIHTFLQVAVDQCEIRIISARKAELPEIRAYQSEHA
ncbi:BrnT family toxin [soil metagenome]